MWNSLANAAVQLKQDIIKFERYNRTSFTVEDNDALFNLITQTIVPGEAVQDVLQTEERGQRTFGECEWLLETVLQEEQN